jgi:hypothetical protein
MRKSPVPVMDGVGIFVVRIVVIRWIISRDLGRACACFRLVPTSLLISEVFAVWNTPHVFF